MINFVQLNHKKDKDMIKLKELVIIISSMVIMSAQMNGQVGIGANTFTPDNSALLELQSTNSGLLLPRMTTAQRNAISNPAQSLIIYNLTTKCVEIYESNQWQAIWCDCIGFSVTASASPSTINSGQSSVLTASGASTYSWSHSLGTGSSKTVSPTSTTTYSVTGTSTAGCTATASVTVTVFKCGTSTVTYDGVTYNTVQIGNQCWLKENLRTTKYNGNNSITNVTNSSTWKSTTSGAYCCYSNNTSNCTTYGALYNWYAVTTGKLCPSGWHVPSDAEWTTLVNYLGGEAVAGGKLKETGTTHWQSPNTGATNSSGFTALPGGYRDGSGGSFGNFGNFGYWWSSTEKDGSSAWDRRLSSNGADVSRSNRNKRHGLSVRCLRD